MRQFLHVMFNRLVPNLREIGLMSPRILPRYEQVGLMKFYDGAAADKLSGPQMIRDLDNPMPISSLPLN
jgi:hypothetical protein